MQSNLSHFLAVFIDTVVAYEFAVTFTSGQLLTKLLLVPGLNLVPIVAHESHFEPRIPLVGEPNE